MRGGGLNAVVVVVVVEDAVAGSVVKLTFELMTDDPTKNRIIDKRRIGSGTGLMIFLKVEGMGCMQENQQKKRCPFSLLERRIVCVRATVRAVICIQ